MAYHKEGNDLVIDGFEQAINQDPLMGIADMRAMNIVAYPKESALQFAPTQASFTSRSGTFTVNTGTDVITPSGTLETNQCITVTNSGGGLPAPLATGTYYWVNSSKQLCTDPGLTVVVDITTSGTGTQNYTTVNMSEPKYYTSRLTYSAPSQVTTTYMLDTAGAVWYSSSGATWIFMGNDLTKTGSNGNGITFLQASDGSGYLFVFRNAAIDYINVQSAGGGGVTILVANWKYNWKPADGSSGGGFNALNTGAGNNLPHEALWCYLDNRVYYCDSSFLGSFYENTATGQIFDPSNAATYTFNQKALYLPLNDSATCLALLGTNILIGGVKNAIYPWNRVPIIISGTQMFGYYQPILLAESYVYRMVTVNTNTYILAGYRGRIYLTNGTNAQLFTKVPDSVVNTPDAIFTWKFIAGFRNQLYFGVNFGGNSAGSTNTIGGVWAVDITNSSNSLSFPTASALRITHQMSYGTWAGFAALVMIIGESASNSGFYIGWSDGLGNYGVDQPGSDPYTTYVSRVDTDLMPVGTILTPKTFSQVEWKASAPLKTGEGIRVSYRINATDSFTTLFESLPTTATKMVSDTSTNYSAVNFQSVQWLQLRVETKSVNNGSFCRLTELRVR